MSGKSLKPLKPPVEDTFSEIRKLLLKASKENKDARNRAPTDAQLAGLSHDNRYIKFGIYILGLAIAALFGFGWTAFTRLDDKVEKKTDYLNARIDSSIQNNSNMVQYIEKNLIDEHFSKNSKPVPLKYSQDNPSIPIKK